MNDLPFSFDKHQLADVQLAEKSDQKGVRVVHRWITQRHYALGYAAVIVKIGPIEKKGRCVLYYCGAKSAWKYPLRIEHLMDTAVGRRSHGIASALLDAYVRFGVPPSAWRLFPVPRRSRTVAAYDRERRSLAQVLAEFRHAVLSDGKPGPLARRFTLVDVDPDASFVALDSNKTEHKEIVAYLKQQYP